MAQETKVKDRAHRSSGPSRGRKPATYTLRIVFTGVVPLVPQYAGGKPKTFWALVSNLTDPSQLPPLPDGAHRPARHKIPVHKNRLLIPKGHLRCAGGRTVRPGVVCGETGQYEYVELINEHLTLEAKSHQRSLKILERKVQRPVPCKKGEDSYGHICQIDRPRREQEHDFQWTVDVNDIAAGLTKKGQKVPHLRKDLFRMIYNPKGYPLISARLTFDRGTVSSRKLARKGDGRYGVYIVPALQGTEPIFLQAVATEVELVLPVWGPATLQSRSLDGSKPDPFPIVLDDRGAQEVTIFLDNAPDLPCADPHRQGEHFAVNFHLFDRPEALAKYAGPTDSDGGPVGQGQCSPPKFKFPT